MRLIGIDYGRKRVGIALSDATGRVAFPHSVLKNDDAFFSTLTELINREGVTQIVIGHSKGLNGEDNVLQAAITDLVTELTLHTGLPVHLEPEQFSTQEALRVQGRTDQTDASAAAIILNSFITHKQ